MINGDGPLEVARQESGYVYHYTNAAGLAGILNTGELWLTHADHLNDRSEGAIGKTVMKLAAERVNGAPMASEDESYLAAASTYILSASEEPDLLNQWQHYGNDGFALAINSSFSRVEYLAINTRRPLRATGWTSVLYMSEESLVHEAAESLAQGVFEENGGNMRVDRELLAEAFRYKHKGFMAEAESRLIFSAPRVDVGYGERARIDPRGRLTRYLPVQVVDRETGQRGVPPIAAIICGPGDLTAQYRTALAVTTLLDQAGYTDMPIYRSGIPYATR